jgi:hypothetical protein
MCLCVSKKRPIYYLVVTKLVFIQFLIRDIRVK